MNVKLSSYVIDYFSPLVLCGLVLIDCITDIICAWCGVSRCAVMFVKWGEWK